MTKYFKTPFAQNGDRVEIPDDIQPDGSLSYEQGYGIDYERPYEDPLSKDIPRDAENQFKHDVTGAVGEIQRLGAAQWNVEAAPYRIHAVVYNSAQAWLSLESDNSDTPSDASPKWFRVSSIVEAQSVIAEILQYGNPLWKASRAPYAEGSAVFYQGKQWLSIIDNNSLEPMVGVSEWYPIAIINLVDIRTPEPIEPLTGGATPATSGPLSASPYAPLYSVDARLHRVFQVAAADDVTFTTPVFEVSVNADSTTISPALATSSNYIWRCKDVAVSSKESGWSLVQQFSTASVYIVAPSVTNPVNGAANVPERPVIQLSAFTVVGGSDTHSGTSVRIKDNLGAIVWSQTNTIPLNNISVPSGVLEVSKTYTVEAKYHGTSIGESAWGSVNSFTTASSFLPTTPGEPFGGGFYAGRMKSDYDGKTYALIVSDGGGDSYQLNGSTHAWKTSNTAVSTVFGTPPATMADGFANHAALKAAGIANFPASKWIEDNCNAGAGLNGQTDWYLPSRDELEMCYRALKPDATANSTNARSTSGFGGDGKGYGTNDNSVPPMLRYTNGDPARATFSNFQTGGTDAMIANFYWSSSEFGASYSWRQSFTSGGQDGLNKTGALYVRAVRRILVS